MSDYIKLSNDTFWKEPWRIISDGNEIGLSFGSGSTATLAQIYAAQPLYSIVIVHGGLIKSGEAPNIYGNVVSIKGSVESRGNFLFLSKGTEGAIYTMGLADGANVPNGSWARIGSGVERNSMSSGFNNSYIQSANWSVVCDRVGNIVNIFGNFTTTYQIPTYTRIFTIPEGYRPRNNIAIGLWDYTHSSLHFGYISASDGTCSTQKTAIQASTAIHLIPLTYCVNT